MQQHHRFFPVSGDAYHPAASALLAFAVGGSDIYHFNIIYLLNRQLNLGLVCLGVHLKRIGIQGFGLMRTLFGNQRSDNYLVRIIHLYYLKHPIQRGYLVSCFARSV